MTNFEKIKNMNIEEMLRFLSHIDTSFHITLNGNKVVNNKGYIYRWLQDEDINYDEFDTQKDYSS